MESVGILGGYVPFSGGSVLIIRCCFVLLLGAIILEGSTIRQFLLG